MTDEKLSEDGDRYAPINRFGSIRHVQRYDMLAYLIWRNGWKRGAELGIDWGSTSKALFEYFPKLHLIGVDIFAYPPLKVGGPPRPTEYHEGKRAAVEKLYSRYKHRARLLAMPTHEAAAHVEDGSLDFVFIDADHRYEAVRQDIDDWAPKLKPHGWLIGHDYFEHFEGVMRAVHDTFGGRHVVWPKTLWGMRRDMIG